MRTVLFDGNMAEEVLIVAVNSISFLQAIITTCSLKKELGEKYLCH